MILCVCVCVRYLNHAINPFAVNNNSYQVQKLKEGGDKFYLIWPEPECTNVCFWYVPKRMRGLPRTPQWDQELGQVS